MRLILLVTALSFMKFAHAEELKKETDASISIRTENRAHPPSSGSTYYIYEKSGQVICTKVETCNKFDECTSEYHKGKFILEDDGQEPSDQEPPVKIEKKKLKSHKCLTKFGLI